MVILPFHHGLQTWQLRASAKNYRQYLYFVGVFDKTIIPLALVGYEMIIANSALRASLTYNHLISKVHSWNKMLPELALKQANAEWNLTSR